MGNNARGQLGDGSVAGKQTPEQIVPNGVTTVAAGSFHTLFIKSDGSLWAMGLNNFGQLGDGTTNDSSTPELIVARNVVSVAAGGDHSLFIMADGSLWAMGHNDSGQLGDGTHMDHLTPVEIIFSPFVLPNAAKLLGGSFQLRFTSTPGGSWIAMAATNLSLQSSNWTTLGTVPEVSPGQFQFTDAQATNYPQRFYRVRSP
jgi:hypothetical protein